MRFLIFFFFSFSLQAKTECRIIGQFFAELALKHSAAEDLYHRDLSVLLRYMEKNNLSSEAPYKNLILKSMKELKTDLPGFLQRLERSHFTLPQYLAKYEEASQQTIRPIPLIQKPFAMAKNLRNTATEVIKSIQELNQFGKRSDLTKKQKTQQMINYLLSLPKEKAKSIYQEVIQGFRERRIKNPLIVPNTLINMGLNSSSMIIFHYLKYGLNHHAENIAQISSLVILEVYLSLISAQTASQLLAKSDLLNKTKLDLLLATQRGATHNSLGIKFGLSQDDLAKVAYAKKVFLNELKEYFRDAHSLAVKSWAISLLPTTLALSQDKKIKEEGTLLGKVLFETTFLSAFISLWANLRYRTIFRMLSPAISNSPRLSPAAKYGSFVALAGANIAVASWSYKWWNDDLDQFFFETDEQRNVESLD